MSDDLASSTTIDQNASVEQSIPVHSRKPNTDYRSSNLCLLVVLILQQINVEINGGM